MNAGQRFWTPLLLRILCGAALSLLPETLVAQTPLETQLPREKTAAPASRLSSKAAEPKPAPSAKEPVKLKVFRMQRHDPEGVVLAAQYLMQGQVSGGISGGGFAGVGGIGGWLTGAGTGIVGFGGIAGGPPAGGMILGGAGGGFPGGTTLIAINSSTVGQTIFVADPRSKALLARGPERDLQIVADLVSVFNSSARNPAPKVKGFQVFKLKYANPEEVALAVTQLKIGAKVAPIIGSSKKREENLRLLLARGTEEQIREVRLVVEAMDVRAEDES
jgi:hypothetical protein